MKKKNKAFFLFRSLLMFVCVYFIFYSSYFLCVCARLPAQLCLGRTVRSSVCVSCCDRNLLPWLLFVFVLFCEYNACVFLCRNLFLFPLSVLFPFVCALSLDEGCLSIRQISGCFLCFFPFLCALSPNEGFLSILSPILFCARTLGCK